MVDCDLIDLYSVDPDSRRKILKYIVDKGIDTWDLGFSPEYVDAALRGEVEVNNMLLCAALRFMDLDEVVNVIGNVPRMATEEDLIRVISSSGTEGTGSRCQPWSMASAAEVTTTPSRPRRCLRSGAAGPPRGTRPCSRTATATGEGDPTRIWSSGLT